MEALDGTRIIQYTTDMNEIYQRYVFSLGPAGAAGSFDFIKKSRKANGLSIIFKKFEYISGNCTQSWKLEHFIEVSPMFKMEPDVCHVRYNIEKHERELLVVFNETKSSKKKRIQREKITGTPTK